MERKHVENIAEEKKEEEIDNVDEQGHGLRYGDLDDESSRVLTGFSVAEIDQLEDVLHSELQPPGEGKQGRPTTTLPNTHDRLLLLLHWLKFGDYFKKVALLFGISKTKAHDIIHEFLARVTPVLAAKFIRQYPRHEQVRNNWIPANFTEAPVIIDSTTQACTKPVGSFRDAKKFYSHKHNKYGIKSITAHAANGLVMFAKSGFPGSVSDVSIAKDPGVLPEVKSLVC